MAVARFLLEMRRILVCDRCVDLVMDSHAIPSVDYVGERAMTDE